MGFSNLATALTVIFFVSVVALISQLVYVLWRHRSFLRHSSPPPPISIGDQTPDFPTADAATKELLYFFCLKPHLPAVDPSKPPTKSTDASSPNDEVVDVFKLLEANGPSRFLCTIKEEDKEDVDSKTSDVDSANRSTKNYAGLQSGVEVAREPVAAEEEEEVSMTVDGDDQNESTKTEFSTPCDSPLFFTPAGSPSRDHMEWDFVVTIHGITGNMDER